MLSTTLKSIVTVGRTVQHKDDQWAGQVMYNGVMTIDTVQNAGMILEIVATPATLNAIGLGQVMRNVILFAIISNATLIMEIAVSAQMRKEIRVIAIKQTAILVIKSACLSIVTLMDAIVLFMLREVMSRIAFREQELWMTLIEA